MNVVLRKVTTYVADPYLIFKDFVAVGEDDYIFTYQDVGLSSTGST